MVVLNWKEAFYPETWSNWALAVLAGWAGVMALKTLCAIRDQTDIQAAAMKQWIELDNWQTGIDGFSGCYTLLVTFNLLNSTNLLLTISHAEIKFQTEPQVTAFIVRSGTPLPPNKPIEISIRLPLTDLKQQAWLTGVLGFGIEGKIVFISALEKKIIQDIDGLVTCSYLQGAKLESVVRLKEKRPQGIASG